MRQSRSPHVHSCMPGTESTAVGSHGIGRPHVRVHSQIPFPQREDVVAVALCAVCGVALERVSDGGKGRDLQVRPCMCSETDWSHMQMGLNSSQRASVVGAGQPRMQRGNLHTVLGPSQPDECCVPLLATALTCKAALSGDPALLKWCRSLGFRQWEQPARYTVRVPCVSKLAELQEQSTVPGQCSVPLSRNSTGRRSYGTLDCSIVILWQLRAHLWLQALADGAQQRRSHAAT